MTIFDRLLDTQIEILAALVSRGLLSLPASCSGRVYSTEIADDDWGLRYWRRMMETRSDGRSPNLGTRKAGGKWKQSRAKVVGAGC